MKVFVQIVDTSNGSCQHALIDEPVKEEHAAANAIAHLVGHVKIDWHFDLKLESIKNKPCTMIGVISETNKIVNVTYYSDEKLRIVNNQK